MHHNLLRYVLLIVIVYATFLIAQSKGRDLRPSDHGLYYEEDSLPPAQSDAATEMRSFFGKPTSSVPLPEAKDIGDTNTWWNVHKDGKSRDTKMNHVRVGLLVASLVCGLIGIVLLAISGVVFLFRLQKKRSGSGGKMERLAIAATSGSGSDGVHAVSSDIKK